MYYIDIKINMDTGNRPYDLSTDIKIDDFINKFKSLSELEDRGKFILPGDPKNTENDVEERYEKLIDLWFDKTHTDCLENPYLVMQNIIHKLKLKNMTMDHINKQAKRTLGEVSYVYSYYSQQGDVDKVSNLIKIYNFIYHSHITASHVNHLSLIYDPNYTLNDVKNYESHLKKFQAPSDIENITPVQSLIYYILNCLSLENIHRYNGECYEAVYSKEGNFTFGWKRKCSILEYLYSKTNKDLHTEQWINATSGKGNYSQVADYLTNCRDYQFPEIEKDRHIFSFSNGIYCTKLGNKKSGYYSKFFYYSDSDEINRCVGNKAAAKYFNREFDHQNDKEWHEIETPSFDKIIDYQFGEEKEFKEIYETLLVLIGRLFYEVGDLEDWQIIPFLKGLAGTGKGTIIKTIKDFFDPADIAVLSNNGETTFGLQGIYDKKIFLAPEIKGDLSLDQAVLQSMISGEDVSVAIKNGTAKTVRWTVPGILAGNELPSYSDNGGSLQRRWVIFGFMKKVLAKDSDASLDRKLTEENPLIMQKCVKAYLNWVNKYSAKGPWSFLSRYFKIQKLLVAEQTNPVYSYLASNVIIVNPNSYVSKTGFRDSLKEFLRSYGGTNKMGKFGPDLFQDPFATYSELYGTPIKYYSSDGRGSFKVTTEFEDGSTKVEEVSQGVITGFELVVKTEEGAVVFETPKKVKVTVELSKKKE